MHEQNNATLEEICLPTYQFTKRRSEKCTNAEISLETSGTFDGKRLADSAQSTTCQGKCKNCSPRNLERICQSRSGNPEFKEKPCRPEQLEAVGVTAGDGRKSLHPESKTVLVGITRPTGSVGVENVMQLLEYQRYRCALTGRKLTPQMAALDHIVPIRFDGEHTIENTQVLHKDVNRAKGSLTNQEFIQLCQEVVLWPKIATSNEESK